MNTHTQDFQIFLDTLSQYMEMPGLHPDPHGACLIVMKGSGVELLFEYDETIVPSTVLVSSIVTPLRPESHNNMLKAILIGNNELNATLSKRPDENEIYLHQRIHPEIELSSLSALIEEFLHTIEIWQQKLAQEGNDE